MPTTAEPAGATSPRRRLSAVLLVGLVLDAALGRGWADPLAGLVIAAVALRGGREAWRGNSCCGPVVVLEATRPPAAAERPPPTRQDPHR